MISCTEFIPFYSEFFKYLESRGGHDAVVAYWHYTSDTGVGNKNNPNSLISFLERADTPFEGAMNYWNHTLTEEASDLYKVIDYEKKQAYSHMRHCPSRGRLNALEHVTPYYDYCEHCNVIYQRILSRYGLIMERDHSKIDNAECSSMLYEEGNRPDVDDIKLPLEGRTVIDMKPEDNKYLHRDFHLSGDRIMKYCGAQFGDEEVVNLLTSYVRNYYAPLIKDIQARGLVALKEWIEHLYEVEEASDVLHTELTDDLLAVAIDKSPAIEHMRSLNQEPSKYYIEQTRTLYRVIAEACDMTFTMLYYDGDGATRLEFRTNK